MIQFWLGTHMPSWLGYVDFPLFISSTRLSGRRTFPRARAPWALDSGAYSILHGGGQFEPPSVYASKVRRYQNEIGQLAWAAPQDWMTEPWITARTGFTVLEHQQRTVNNYLDLCSIAPDLPFRPVLQGQTLGDYLRCIDLYAGAGVDLTQQELVGLGSVCRRQGTAEIGQIVSALSGQGLRLHGFGMKIRGLTAYAGAVTSADSMAWSFRGRHVAGCGTPRPHKTEANCMNFAKIWRNRLLGMIE